MILRFLSQQTRLHKVFKERVSKGAGEWNYLIVEGNFSNTAFHTPSVKKRLFSA
jgi:hypothetical protein